MATTNVYRVIYHGEVAGKIVGTTQQAVLGAAANDFNTIRAVLSSNSLLPQGTLVIDEVNALPSGPQTIFT